MRKHKSSVYIDPQLLADAAAVGITNASAVLDEALRIKVMDAMSKQVKSSMVECEHCGSSFAIVAWLRVTDDKKGKCLCCGKPIKMKGRKKV